MAFFSSIHIFYVPYANVIISCLGDYLPCPYARHSCNKGVIQFHSFNAGVTPQATTSGQSWSLISFIIYLIHGELIFRYLTLKLKKFVLIIIFFVRNFIDRKIAKKIWNIPKIYCMNTFSSLTPFLPIFPRGIHISLALL